MDIGLVWLLLLPNLGIVLILIGLFWLFFNFNLGILLGASGTFRLLVVVVAEKDTVKEKKRLWGLCGLYLVFIPSLFRNKNFVLNVF